LTVSGGNDRTTFYLSAENNHHNGMFLGPNDMFNRTSVRVKGTHRLTDNLRVGGNLAFASTSGAFIERGNNVNGLELALLRTPPNFNNNPYLDAVTGFHRSFRRQHPDSLIEDRGFDNPLYILYEQKNTSDVGRVFGNVNVDYLANTGLKLSNTTKRDPPIDAETNIHDLSFFGQGTLDGYDQLHLTVAARNDGSSTFGLENQRSWFPKASVAWEFTKAMSPPSWLQFGKL